MNKTSLIALALALPLTSVPALAQQASPAEIAATVRAVGAGSARPAASAPAAAPAMPSGSGVAAGGGFRGGGAGGAFVGRGGGGPVIGAGPQVGNTGWVGPRQHWQGRHHYPQRRHVFTGPSIWFGSTYAASPYYYDYYDEPYFYEGGVAASPEEVAYCRRKYKSYDIRSGTWLSKDGNRYPCP